MCTLRPGVRGLSDNIHVRSILGRFLEHSRIFRFGADQATAEYWMGSADLMHRNLDRRVEALVLVTDPQARGELDGLMTAAMSDDSASFELLADGTWVRRESTLDRPLVNLQDALLRRIVGTGG
jgi:polyphosphate kinase